MNAQLAQKIKGSLQTEVYTDLVEFLNSQLRDLKNIDNVRELQDPVDQAVELKAQKKAYDKLDAILSTIIAIKETPDAESEDGNDYGVDEEK